MCIYKNKLKKILPTANILAYDRFLFIGAHCGDIAKSSGATVALLRENKKHVKFLICTDTASFADSELSYNERKEIKQKEELCAAMLLDVKEVEFLPFKDFGDYDKTELYKELTDVITGYKPDVIFVSDKTVNEINDDDQTVTKIVEQIFLTLRNKNQCAQRNLPYTPIKAIAYYNTGKPNYYFNTAKYVARELQAVMAYESELPKKNEEKYEYMLTYSVYINTKMKKNGMKNKFRKSEGFRVITVKSSHNFPETIM